MAVPSTVLSHSVQVTAGSAELWYMSYRGEERIVR